MAQEAKEKHSKSKRTTAAASDSVKIEEVPLPSDSEEDSEDTVEYIPPDEPHMCPHLLAVAMPSETSFFRVTPLIDSGCGTVLIKPEFADALSARQIAMREPE